LLFFGKVNIFYQFNKNKGLIDRVDMTIDNGLWKGYNFISLSAENFAAANAPDSQVIKNNNAVTQDMLRAMAQRDKKEKMLAEVVVKAKVKSEKEKMDERYTSGMFRGGDGYSFDVANDPFAQGSQTVFNYLQGKVAGLQINTTGGEPTLSWRGGAPGLYLDEMSVDASMLQSMSMSDVAYIKVFRPPFMGFGGGNGGIAVYTKRGGGVTVSNVRGLESASLMGYTPIKEFYSPDYSTYLPAHDVDDIRTTLLWEPYILLDKSNRKASLTFYNNDITKRFRVVVEGVTETGKLVRVEKVIQ
jgi:hypothetical protein